MLHFSHHGFVRTLLCYFSPFIYSADWPFENVMKVPARYWAMFYEDFEIVDSQQVCFSTATAAVTHIPNHKSIVNSMFPFLPRLEWARRQIECVLSLVGRFLNRCIIFCALWLVTTYLYALSLRALLATDVMALFATNVACAYLLSWVILHEQFVGVRVSRLITAAPSLNHRNRIVVSLSQIVAVILVRNSFRDDDIQMLAATHAPSRWSSVTLESLCWLTWTA